MRMLVSGNNRQNFRDCGEIGLGKFPIHEVVQEPLNIIRPGIVMVEIIGMLPQVADQQCGLTMRQWEISIGRRDDVAGQSRRARRKVSRICRVSWLRTRLG